MVNNWRIMYSDTGGAAQIGGQSKWRILEQMTTLEARLR